MIYGAIIVLEILSVWIAAATDEAHRLFTPVALTFLVAKQHLTLPLAFVSVIQQVDDDLFHFEKYAVSSAVG
jgi:hypothetical protein